MSQANPNSLHYEQETPDKAYHKTTVACYTADEVLRQFFALYNCMDFEVELEKIGISRFQFFRRKKALREFRALSIALWSLALQKSFPDDAKNFFTRFWTSASNPVGNGKEGEKLQSRVAVYVELLSAKKDSTFLPVAAYLVDEMKLYQEDLQSLRLRLSLIMRDLYTLIFSRLV